MSQPQSDYQFSQAGTPIAYMQPTGHTEAPLLCVSLYCPDLAEKERKKRLIHTKPTQTNLDPRQPPLRMRCAKHPTPSQRTKARLRMVRHKELLLRPILKPLRATPRHILDREKGAIRHDDIIQDAIRNDRLIQTLNHAWQDRECGRWTVICVVDEDVFGSTFLPDLLGSVDRGLHVAAVEVDAGALGEVVEGAGETEHVPE